MRDLRGILFDFGGTLDGPAEPWVARFAVAYAAVGVAVPYDRLQAASGHGTRESYRNPALPGFSLPETVAFHVDCQFAHLNIADPAAVRAIVNHFVARTERALVESRALLTRLHPRFRLGVVSNFYGNVARLLTDAGIAPLLTTIVDSTVVGISKPDPRILTLAAERLGCAAAETLYVGDSLEHDIVPARAAGLQAAWVVGERAAPVASPAQIHVRSLADLEAALAS